MPITSITTGGIGASGQTPNILFITTTDTIVQVKATGYLNKAFSQGIPMSDLTMALVSTKSTPGDLASDIAWLEVHESGGNWSLTAAASSGVLSVSGTANRITSSGGANPIINISAAYIGQSSITTLGTISTGVWGSSATPIGLASGGSNAALTASAGGVIYSTASAMAISTVGSSGQVLTSAGAGAPVWATPTTGTVTSVSGTANRITSTGGSTPIIDISAAYIGQNSITTLGTISTGVWGSSATKIGLTSGGTNTSLTAAAGGIVYSTSSGMGISAVGTTGEVLVSGGAGAPTWTAPTYPVVIGATGTLLRSDGTNWVATTSTYPNTNAVSTLLYASSANVMGALATTNRASLSTNSTGVPTWLALTDGQLVIGSSAGAPAAATLTAGTGITITNASNSITIAASTGGFTWNNVTGTSASMAVENGYGANNAGLVTLTLPVTAAQFTEIQVSGIGAGGWTIAQNANQLIHVGSVASTTGVGGSVSSTNRYDQVTLLCVVANTEWAVTANFGALAHV